MRELSTENLVQLPFQKNVFLCSKSKTRWILNKGDLYRDMDGENDWKKMGAYVGKTYLEIFDSSYDYAMKV